MISLRIKSFKHAQRIGTETFKEYNVPTSHRQLEQLIRYAELIGNNKN